MNRILCQRFREFISLSLRCIWQGNLSIVRNEEETEEEWGREREERVISVGDWKEFEVDNDVKERTVGEPIFCLWLEDSHS